MINTTCEKGDAQIICIFCTETVGAAMRCATVQKEVLFIETEISLLLER